MRQEVGTATTQHGDMMGTAAVDWETLGGGLHELAKSLGIDTDRYRPLAVSFHGKRPTDLARVVVGWPLTLTAIHTVDTDKTGKSDEEINDYARSHGGAVPVKKSTSRRRQKPWISAASSSVSTWS